MLKTSLTANSTPSCHRRHKRRIVLFIVLGRFLPTRIAVSVMSIVWTLAITSLCSDGFSSDSFHYAHDLLVLLLGIGMDTTPSLYPQPRRISKGKHSTKPYPRHRTNRRHHHRSRRHPRRLAWRTNAV